MKTFTALAGICLLLSLRTISLAQSPSPSARPFPSLAPVPHTGKLPVPSPAPSAFCFIAAGDNRPNDADPAPPKMLTTVLKDTHQFKPVFFIWGGDIIYGRKLDETELEKEYKGFFDVAEKHAKAPIFNAPGNHEMDTTQKEGGVKIQTGNEAMHKLYRKYMKVPKSNPGAYGAFNYGNSRFIALDTEEVPPSQPTPPPSIADCKDKFDPGYVSKAQLDALSADLDANAGLAHIFVFMHHPIMPLNDCSSLNSANVTTLKNLFSSHPNVSCVVASHEHLYFNATGTGLNDPAPSGPSYLISGGAGAKLDSCHDAGANCVSVNHYVVFNVNGDAVTFEMHEVADEDKKSEQ
jgi:hypothetical protein